MKNKIIYIEPQSIAEELGIQPGDTLLEINGKRIKDVFDYRFLMQDEYVELLVQKQDGEQWLLEVEKDEDEELGVDFDSGLMDKAMECRNKCVFCFIDQLPRGMRGTLYFKDDDPRLSFLTGNYVTLTNMSDRELERIIYYHLSPINISVHSANMAVRRSMLRNPAADKLLTHLERLNNAGITMNFQIVLCKGINDGKDLDETISELSSFIPNAKSLSVVPAGLSRHRNGLYPLQLFTQEDCIGVLKQIHDAQACIMKTHGTRFVYAADEFYIKAGMDMPEYEEYDDFPQLENGVGMLPLFIKEFNESLDGITDCDIGKNSVSLVTSIAAYNYIKEMSDRLSQKFSQVTINVFSIVNEFFGHEITVSGLLTGGDILNALKGKSLGRRLLIPQNALRADDCVFLDDMSLSELGNALGVEVRAVGTDGVQFIKNILY